jgi:glycosyltransferase involved in cell wall biosynthesis
MSSRQGLVPQIQSVPADVARPFWSVMIPTYNCDDLFEQTLRCVLDQDPGADQMQIAVVDDRSPNGRSREIVEKLAPDRVEFHEQPSNVGLAGNWNSCIEKSRGHWVHILHQDDLVVLGFYERMERPARERPDVGAAFCRYAYIDGSGDRVGLAAAESETPGVLEGWADLIAVGQRIECPSIVVKRAVYENLGGFRDDLCYALDWEMWVRIAFRYPVWHEPEILACWRRHDASESKRLEGLNLQLPDFDKALTVFHGFAPEAKRDRLMRQAAREMRWRYLQEVHRLMEAGRPWSALGRIRSAYRFEGWLTRTLALLNYSRWATKVWLRGLNPGKPPARADAL